MVIEILFTFGLDREEHRKIKYMKGSVLILDYAGHLSRTSIKMNTVSEPIIKRIYSKASIAAAVIKREPVVMRSLVAGVALSAGKQNEYSA